MRRVVFIILIALFVTSCAKNPFSTRDSEPPTAAAGTFITPTTPQIVLENLRLCYFELVIGNFVQSLDSNFVFKYDFLQGAQADSGWGFKQELNLTEKMFNDFSATKSERSLRVTFIAQPEQPDIILDSTATLVRSYTVIVADSSGQMLSSYQGVVRFEMIESAFNFWAIRSWSDLHLNLDTPSWAELKNAYR
ncbi:MAG: hypothetical protein NT028_05085 [candidate division Zixibacteria bacterium]|nr:hypothetical protein [candidate division Zixibacteria bacterium]